MSIIAAILLLPQRVFAQGQKEPSLPPGAVRCLARAANESLHTFAFSPDGKTVAVAHDEVGLWDLKSGKKFPQRFADTRVTTSLVFSPDGKTLVVTNTTPGQGVVAFDVASGKLIHKFFPRRIGGAWMDGTVLSPDGKTLATNIDSKVRFWDLASRAELSKPRIPPGADRCGIPLCYAPDGKTLATSSSVNPWSPKGRSARVQLWDTSTGQLLRTFEGTGDHYIKSVAFTPDGRLLACGVLERKRDLRPGDDPRAPPQLGDWVEIARVRLWEVATGKEVLTCQLGRSAWGVPCADGRHLLTAGEESDMILWDAVEGKRLHTFGFENNTNIYSYICSGRFAPDGKTFVTINYEKDATALYFWDVGSKLKPLAKGPVLDDKALERLWAALGGVDALHARKALWALFASPGQSVPFLSKRLRPTPGTSVKADDAKAIERLVAALDGSHYATRVYARVQLERLGSHAEAALRRALKNPASPHQKREIEAVLKAIEWPYTSPDRLQRLRAIEALERIGTSEARKMLEEMARGAPGVPETEDARASVQRLAKRDARKP